MNKLLAIILIACSLLLLFFQYPCLFCVLVLGYLKVAILDIGIPKSYCHCYYSDCEQAVISKDANKIRRR